MAAAPSPRLGVTLSDDGSSFRVWAPHAQSVHLELRDGTALPLSRDGDTWAAAFAPGTFLLQGALSCHAAMHAPDAPCNHVQECCGRARSTRSCW